MKIISPQNRRRTKGSKRSLTPAYRGRHGGVFEDFGKVIVRLMRGLLFGLSPFDAPTAATVAALLATVAIISALVHALAADPLMLRAVCSGQAGSARVEDQPFIDGEKSIDAEPAEDVRGGSDADVLQPPHPTVRGY